MTTLIQPGALLGVLGGGQLGAMFSVAAARLGYRAAVWDPDATAPAHRFAEWSVCEPFDQPAACGEFARRVAAATFEWENVSPATLAALEPSMPVRPSARVLHTIQHRVRQKAFLAEHGLPTPRFVPVDRREDLPSASRTVGYPSVCKTATFGYDGKGQWVLADAQAAERLSPRLIIPGVSQWIVEEWVRFEKELSVLVVRGESGDTRIYPVVENEHEEGILRVTRAPALIDETVANRAADLATAAITRLGGVGVFCVELFLASDGRLLINEIAPRPHNSGHYTLDACTVSQFEQQVRTLGGLPLGEVRLLSPAVMVNLIGDELTRVTAERGLRDLLHVPGAVLHVYGKKEVRPRRKMGHVTFLAENSPMAWAAAQTLLDALRQGVT